MISSQDHTPSVIPITQQETTRQLPVTEADDNTFMAHVIIEQALHLPTVPGDNDTRYLITYSIIFRGKNKLTYTWLDVVMMIIFKINTGVRA